MDPSARIAPEAFIGEGAVVGAGCAVGPMAWVGPGVQLGAGSRVGARAWLGPGVHVGPGCWIDVGAVLGGPEEAVPRSTPATTGTGAGSPAPVVVLEPEVTVREYVRVEPGRYPATPTRIGTGAYVMGRSSIGAGAHLEPGVIVTHGSVVGAAARIGRRAIIGGMSTVDPETVVGRQAMIGGLSRVARPVPPFAMANGVPARVFDINVVGLRRSGIAPAVRAALRRLMRLLYHARATPQQALASIDPQAREAEEIRVLLAFAHEYPPGEEPADTDGPDLDAHGPGDPNDTGL